MRGRSNAYVVVATFDGNTMATYVLNLSTGQLTPTS